MVVDNKLFCNHARLSDALLRCMNDVAMCRSVSRNQMLRCAAREHDAFDYYDAEHANSREQTQDKHLTNTCKLSEVNLERCITSRIRALFPDSC